MQKRFCASIMLMLGLLKSDNNIFSCDISACFHTCSDIHCRHINVVFCSVSFYCSHLVWWICELLRRRLSLRYPNFAETSCLQLYTAVENLFETLLRFIVAKLARALIIICLYIIYSLHFNFVDKFIISKLVINIYFKTHHIFIYISKSKYYV